MRLTTPEISWHGKEPIFSLDFSLELNSARLATSGADSNIRMWALYGDEDNDSRVEFISNLSRHTKAVNVVRFSPVGNMLASGGDDCYVIIWQLLDDGTDGFSQPSSINSEIESKESWQVSKMLRGHIEDVYDLAWSPNGLQLLSGSVDNSAIIWDTNKGEKLKIIQDHRQYVQGVCWDPCGAYVATYSCDRTCRIYATSNFRCCYNINKMAIPNGTKSERGNQVSGHIKLFHDETMPSFFRRLTFSPDGSLLLVPGGKFEDQGKVLNTTFVFTKASMNKPVMYFPASKQPTVAVKCCPVLFELRPSNAENSTEQAKSVFKLPYRVVIAVASLDSVVFYDTQQTLPFAFLSNMHYASLTDISWSSDGKILAVSSRDGYCTLVRFEKNELGVAYHQTPREVIEKGEVFKAAVGGRNDLTPKNTANDATKGERISPKNEKLTIKKFLIVNPRESNPTTTYSKQDVEDEKKTTAPAPRRVGFVTIKSARDSSPHNVPDQANKNSSPTLQSLRNMSLEQHEQSNSGQVLRMDSSEQGNSDDVVSTVAEVQPRRVSFVTLQSVAKSAGTTCPNPSASSSCNTFKASESKVNDNSVPTTSQSLPRRVDFQTIRLFNMPKDNENVTSSNLALATQSIVKASLPSQNPHITSLTTDSVQSEPSAIIQIPRAKLSTGEASSSERFGQPFPLEPEVIVIKR